MRHTIRAASPSRRAVETKAAKKNRPMPEASPSERTLLEDLDQLRLSLLTGRK